MSRGDKLTVFFCCMFFVGIISFAVWAGMRNTNEYVSEPASTSTNDIDNIIAAEAYVRSLLNYPDTADFHDMKTRVSGDTVTLTVTAKNAFGVPETRTFGVKVINGRVVR
jgi:hypothetical protein